MGSRVQEAACCLAVAPAGVEHEAACHSLQAHRLLRPQVAAHRRCPAEEVCSGDQLSEDVGEEVSLLLGQLLARATARGWMLLLRNSRLVAPSRAWVRSDHCRTAALLLRATRRGYVGLEMVVPERGHRWLLYSLGETCYCAEFSSHQPRTSLYDNCR